MAYRRRGNVVPGQFGRRPAGPPAASSTDWLSPEAYNALSRDEKMALAKRRQMRATQSPRPPARAWKRRRKRRLPWWQYQGLVALTAIAAIAVVGSSDALFSKQSVATPSDAMEVRTHFGLCHTGGGTNCVVDGDTIWREGVKVRVADIDAPETHDPRCAAEKALGDRATLRLQQLLNGGAVSLSPIDRDEDRFGRKLRIVRVDGSSVGDSLVAEGLARPYAGGRRPWC